MFDRGTLICITGVDGAGKTTASKGVANALKKADEDVVYIWGRYQPILLYPFWKLAVLLFTESNGQDSGYQNYANSKYESTASHPFLSKVYRLILYIDYWPQLLIKVYFPLLFGKTVICDRYVYDTIIVDIANEFHYTIPETNKLIESYLEFVCSPDENIFIDVPEEVALKRKSDIPDIQYLTERASFYREMADYFNHEVVDGTQCIEEVRNEILQIICKSDISEKTKSKLKDLNYVD